MVRASVRVGCALVVVGGDARHRAPRLPAPAPVRPTRSESLPAAGPATARMVPTYGRNEQFRCIVTYAVGEAASRVRQHLRCQGDDTRFDAVTRLDIEKRPGHRRVGGEHLFAQRHRARHGHGQGLRYPAARHLLPGQDDRGRQSPASNRSSSFPKASGSMKEMAAVLTKSDRARICDPARVIVPPVPVPAVRPAHLDGARSARSLRAGSRGAGRGRPHSPLTCTFTV